MQQRFFFPTLCFTLGAWPLLSQVKSARAPLTQPFMLHSEANVHTVCVRVSIFHMLIVRQELHKAPRLHSWVDTWTGTTKVMCATATRTRTGWSQSARIISTFRLLFLQLYLADLGMQLEFYTHSCKKVWTNSFGLCFAHIVNCHLCCGCIDVSINRIEYVTDFH